MVEILTMLYLDVSFGPLGNRFKKEHLLVYDTLTSLAKCKFLPITEVEKFCCLDMLFLPSSLKTVSPFAVSNYV